MEKKENQVAYKVTYSTADECTCPVCGSHNIQNVTRITGYLSLDERFGPGKVEERADRVAHNCEASKKIYR